MSTVQADIEARLAEAEPDVEVLLAEEAGGGILRVFIDHPGGVSLELCERVTRHLNELRASHALEVPSPVPSTSAASSAAAPASARRGPARSPASSWPPATPT